MTYIVDVNGAAGSIPEFGAIFMASTLLKRECFKHNVFALPYSAAEFVKHVKAGMILFLFEFEGRKLFGVFKASSDGAMDIVPGGINSSKRRYPAQVRFTPIWSCHPLSEKEFQNAIGENYYSSKKFNFGLSKDQVRKLLYLFNSRRIKDKLSLRLPAELQEEGVGKDRGVAKYDRFALSERAYSEPSHYDDFNQSVLSDYQGISTSRATGYGPLRENVINMEEKAYHVAQGLITNNHDSSLSKRRRVNYDDDLLINDEPAYEAFNDQDTLRPFSIDHPMDPSDKGKRLLDGRPLFTGDREYNENQVDTDFKNFTSNKYPVGSFGGRAPYDDRLIQKDRLFSEYNLEDGSNQALASDHYGSFNKNWHGIYDQSMAGISSENFAPRLQRGDRIFHDENFPIVEGRITENMVDNSIYSSSLNKNSEYFSRAGGRVFGDGGFRKSDRVENVEDIYQFTNPVISTNNASFFKPPDQKMCSFLDTCSPEGYSHMTVAQKVDPSMFTDATITRAVSYAPELTNVAHGCSASLAADRLSSLVRDNHPHLDSLRNPYSLSKIMSSPYFMESKKSNSSLDVSPELGNKYFSANTSGHHGSLLHETTSSFLNSNLLMHLNPNTSPPVDYNGPLFSKHSLPSMRAAHLENVEGDQEWLFVSPSKSSEKHFTHNVHSSMPLEHVSEYVSWKHMENLPGKDFVCSEARNPIEDVNHPERDYSSYRNQQLKISSNMNLKERHAISEAQLSDSNNSRRSVFTRLTSGQNVHGGDKKNETQYDHYMTASVEDIMGMLQQDKDLPPRKLMKSHVIGQYEHFEKSLGEKQTHFHSDISHSTMQKYHFHSDISHSTMQKYNLKDANIGTEMIDEGPKEKPIVDFKRRSVTKKSLVESITDSTLQKYNLKDANIGTEMIEEGPKEKPIVDFKRRSETKKSLVEPITDPSVENLNTNVNGEGECFPKKILRRKLVRPVFQKNESTAEGIESNPRLHISGLSHEKGDQRECEKAISICEGEMPNDKARLENTLASATQSNKNKHSSMEEQNNMGAHVQQPKSDNLEEENIKSNRGIQTSTLLIVDKETTFDKGSKLLTPKTPKRFLSKKIASTGKSLNLDELSSEGPKSGGDFEKIREEKGLIPKRRMKLMRTWKTEVKSS